MAQPIERTDAYQEFIAKYPRYESTAVLDELRAREFSRLDRLGQIYLDYTGGALYPESLVKRHAEQLLGGVYGNPHSTNPSSQAATRLVDAARRRVIDFFHASPAEYAVIFTCNATHALKLVGEAYPFARGDQFLLTFDNHNSVNGIREYDRARGAVTRYVPIFPPEMRVPDDVIEAYLSQAARDRHGLFAFPAQSNFSGVQHPLEWIERAHKKGWDVLLDAAAFVPSNPLDLSCYHPDFVTISFYKMFGYPTGIGALIAHRSALEKLRRPWFAGGTITVASVQADQFFMQRGHEAFEDGTINYAGIPAVTMGLDFIDEIGLDTIHTRVKCLTGWLIEQLHALRHGNGRPVALLYGPPNLDMRGGAVTINVYDPSGVGVDHDIVEKRANERGISLRTGCFCNPGAGEVALGIDGEEIQVCFSRPGTRMTYDTFRQCIDGKSTGAVRISVGMVSNFADVQKAIELIGEFADE